MGKQDHVDHNSVVQDWRQNAGIPDLKAKLLHA